MATNRSPEDVLALYPEQVRALAEEVRGLVRRVLPGLAERADPSISMLGYSYAPGHRGMVAMIMLSKTGVKLGIVNGAMLPDPRGLMAGEGKVHRHVPLKTTADLKRPGISALLKGASRMCRERLGDVEVRT